ncbi:MAG: hypothetical protein KGL46_13155 [Hyphomicrobiales bacterium]|nr:hypothetical protein [Hyphomicrobiales bacterium]
MTDLNFRLVLELVDKASASVRKVMDAEKAMADASQAANAAALQSSAKTEAALKSQANAAKSVASAHKTIEASARASGAASVASANRMTQAMQHAAQALSRVKGASGAMLKAGALAGKEFARGVGDAVKAEVPRMIGGALHNAWSRATGFQFMSGPGALRANAGAAATGLMGWVGNTVLSNAQTAGEARERLRADLGEAGARRAVAAADAAMVRTPFQRDDVRASLPDLVGAGVDPASERFRTIADAAAGSGQTMAQAAAAYRAARGGDLAALGTFGIGVKTGDDGSSTLSYQANGAATNIVVNASNQADLQAKIDAALNARFAGGADRKSMSIDGMLNKASNAWSMFAGKVMDAGPMDYIREKLGAALKAFDDMATNGKLDELARTVGVTIKEAFIEADAKIRQAWTALQGFGDKIMPLIDGLGGLATAFKVLTGVAVVGWVSGIISPFFMLASVLGAMSATAIGVSAAIVAIAAGAYLVSANWDKIGPALERAWIGVKTAVSDAWEAIKTAVSDGLSTIKNSLSSAWESVKASAKAAWSGLSEAVTSGLNAAIDAMREWGGKALKAMQAAFNPVVDWVKGKAEALGEVWDGVKGGASKIAAAVGIGDSAPAPQTPAQQIADAGKASAAIALLDELQSKLPGAAAAVASFDLVGPVAAAVEAARGAIAGVSFHAEGVAMMQTLAAGIRAGASTATAAVASVAQQMRDYLPHSPAKVGPLSDLDEVRFSETLASAIRPGPAVEAVKAVAVGMAGAVTAPRIGVLANMSNGDAAPAVATAGAGGRGGDVHVAFAPNIAIAEGKERDGAFVVGLLRQHAYELAEIIRGQDRQRDRLSYGDA